MGIVGRDGSLEDWGWTLSLETSLTGHDLEMNQTQQTGGHMMVVYNCHYHGTGLLSLLGTRVFGRCHYSGSWSDGTPSLWRSH